MHQGTKKPQLSLLGQINQKLIRQQESVYLPRQAKQIKNRKKLSVMFLIIQFLELYP